MIKSTADEEERRGGAIPNAGIQTLYTRVSIAEEEEEETLMPFALLCLLSLLWLAGWIHLLMTHSTTRTKPCQAKRACDDEIARAKE
jgi:hypothetical protein